MNPSRHERIIFSLVASGLLVVGMLLLLRETSRVADADSQVLFVGTDGIDSSNCTDSNVPCRTIQYAVDQAGKGDEIRVAQGIYTENLTIDIKIMLSGGAEPVAEQPGSDHGGGRGQRSH
jgi:hypothetical protein